MSRNVLSESPSRGQRPEFDFPAPPLEVVGCFGRRPQEAHKAVWAAPLGRPPSHASERRESVPSTVTVAAWPHGTRTSPKLVGIYGLSWAVPNAHDVPKCLSECPSRDGAAASGGNACARSPPIYRPRRANPPCGRKHIRLQVQLILRLGGLRHLDEWPVQSGPRPRVETVRRASPAEPAVSGSWSRADQARCTSSSSPPSACSRRTRFTNRLLAAEALQ
jgi:hypothetical protein